jgi:hypothetical protein
MEGKKRRALGQNCHAVSEVYGQLLMMSIVVLAFSTIALTVFSDGGVVKPEHVPRIDLQENFKKNTNIVQIVHNGGEAIDLDAIKIIIHKANGDESEFYRSNFKVKNPDGIDSSDEVFALGDCIEIDTSGMDIDEWEDIDLFFVDIPSQQVIQRAVLQTGIRELPDWITPHPYGSVHSNSTESGEWEWKSTESVGDIDDGLLTDSHIPKRDWVAEDYTFGIDADEIGISNSLKKILLKIIYQTGDNSPKNLTLSIFNGTEWTLIASNMPTYHTVEDCMDANVGDYNGATTYDITQYVNTTRKLEELKVRFSISGHADEASGKIGWVDFVGIHVER